MCTINKKSTPPRIILFYLLIFGFFMIWFNQIHPLTVYDADDWAYISHPRRAVPIWWSYWNPSRIFPEIFMPLCSSLAAFLVYPLTGNYLRAMVLTHGFVVSLFLTIYIWSITRMMRRLFKLSTISTMLCTVLFLLAHFLILRTNDTGNTYLFNCWDLTCYYYYMIPAAVNASLVMWMIGNPRFSTFPFSQNPGKMGLFVLLLYLAVFSNLPDSGIFAVYAGCIVLIGIFSLLRRKTDWKTFLQKYGFFLTILLVWLLSAIFELNGGRAHSVTGPKVDFGLRLRTAAYGIFTLVFRCNWVLMAVSIVTVAAALALLLRSHGAAPEDRRFAALLPVCLIAIAAMAVYTLLLCAAVDSSYANRSEYLFGLLFFALLLVMLSLGYLLQKLPRLLYVLPLAVCVLFCECNTWGVTYLESNYSNLDPAICDEITGDLIDEILRADQEGLGEIALEVPLCQGGGNWPLCPEFLPERMVNSLLEHGVLRRKINVTMVASMEANWRYGLPILD